VLNILFTDSPIKKLIDNLVLKTDNDIENI